MPSKYFILTAALLISQILRAQDSTKYIVLNSVEPTEDVSDLRQLDPYFENVRVVGMGESTHGTHEFTTMRLRIFQYLVENHDFNTFFLEGEYASCLHANKYIHGSDDNANEVVEEIDQWPWMTAEMVDVVNWMREYNNTHPGKPLNFIGVDSQKYTTTLNRMDKILTRYNLPTTDTTVYKPISDGEFMMLKKKRDVAPFTKLLKIKADVNTDSFSAEDRTEYANLLRHFRQIIEIKSLRKDRDQAYTRDESMAQNILFNLDSNLKMKGIFWAHNGHVSTVSLNEFGTNKWSGYTGGYLKEVLGEKYLSIAFDFDEGSFNAYYPDKNSKLVIKKHGYTLGSSTVGSSVDGTFASYYRKIPGIVFVDFANLPEERLFINDVGAAFFPDKVKGIGSTARYNYYGPKGFDAIIIIPKTTATHLLRWDE